MRTLEAAAFAIVALFVVVRARRDAEPRAFLVRLAGLAVVSFLAEDTCIHAYRFYAYSAEWSLFVDRVPLAILLIWPVVIHSAWDLARHLLGRGHALVPLAGAALVLADAWLIEPVSVAARLWSWSEPGLFGVPPIGVFGWSFHAGLCMLALSRTELSRDGARAAHEPHPLAAALPLVATPLGTHALLVASWWGLFRWVNVALPAWPVVVIAWCLSLALVAWFLAARARQRVPLADMLLRAPAASFFFVLLAVVAAEGHAAAVVAPLTAWVLAFAPPYLSLMSKPDASTDSALARPA